MFIKADRRIGSIKIEGTQSDASELLREVLCGYPEQLREARRAQWDDR
jgi:hypothetical protein